MKYEDAMDVIADLIEDCTNPKWNFNDDSNWESLVGQLERLRTYTTLAYEKVTVVSTDTSRIAGLRDCASASII